MLYPRSYALLIVLMACSYALVGLLTLWAATSRRHWFIRTAVVFACAALFLWRPMFEPFFGVLWVQVFVLWGLAISRAWRRWRLRRKLGGGWGWRRKWQPRFSLAELGLATVPIAILTATMAATPSKLRPAILLVAPEAMLIAMLALLSYWWFRTRRGLPRRIFTTLVWLAVITVVGTRSFLGSAYITAMWGMSYYPMPGFWEQYGGYLAWLFTSSLCFALLTLLLRSFRVLSTARQMPTKPAWVMLAAICVLPMLAAWELSTPLAIPPTPAGKPLDIARLNAELQRINQSQLMAEYNREPQNLAALAIQVAAQESDYARIAKLFDDDPKLPLQVYSTSLPAMSDLRGVARMWDAKSIAARIAGEGEVCVESAVQILKVARLLSDGVLVHWLVSIAMEGIAVRSLHDGRSIFNESELNEAIALLEAWDQTRPALKDVLHRETVAMQRQYGWQQHAMFMLMSWANEFEDEHDRCVQTLHRAQAVLRLGVVELELERYRLAQKTYPERIEELSLIKELLTDPYNTAGEPFVYNRTNGGYQLYSVGPDGDDDHQKSLQRPGGYDLEANGDFWLDDFYSE